MILCNVFTFKESSWGLLPKQHLVVDWKHACFDVWDVYAWSVIAEKVDVVFLDDGGVGYRIAVS